MTLAGSGGIGKTRLAQAALAAWPEGGAWVELAALTAAEQVAAAVVRALGPAASPQPLEAVAASLAATPRLVVLDNAEHVLAGVVALAGALHGQAPQARLLVTSQEVLRLPHEQVLRLAPLALLAPARHGHRVGAAAAAQRAAALLAAEVDNARAALHWAAGEADLALGVQLATEASFAFMGANLHAEYLGLAAPWVARLEHGGVEPTAAAGLLRRVAATGKNGGHALALRAALRAAELLRAGAGDARELHEVLVVTVAVGARRGEALPFEALLAEARALQRPDWPLAPIANWHWAHERWLMRAGRLEEALATGLAQAEALRDHAAIGAPQVLLINAANNELALGRAAQAEARARAAIDALAPVGVQASAVGYGWGLVAACEAERGAWADALASCRRARLLLEIEGDDVLLLPVLAACALGRGRADAAARIAGHLDAYQARSGGTPWPAEAAVRARLQARLAAALSPVVLDAALEAGATLSRSEALGLGFATG